MTDAPLLPNEQDLDFAIDWIIADQQETIHKVQLKKRIKDFVVLHTQQQVKKAEEHGYMLGWNSCVDDCPDKMSTEPLSEEETE